MKKQPAEVPSFWSRFLRSPGITAPTRLALLRARAARACGLNVHMRGADRIVRLLFPPDQRRTYIEGDIQALDGTLYHVDTRSFLEWSLWVYGRYELDVQQAMRRWLRPGDIAVDVGANVGIHSCAMARLVGPDGCVIAIEPVAGLAERLNANCELNGLRNVQLVTKAASSRSGVELFFPPGPSDPNQGQGSFDWRAGLVQAPQKVDLETVDAILEARDIQRLRLVKIDVEGHELAVLRGMERSLRRWRPCVLFEFNPHVSHGVGREWVDVRNGLEILSEYQLLRFGYAGALKPLPRIVPEHPFMIAAIPIASAEA